MTHKTINPFSVSLEELRAVAARQNVKCNELAGEVTGLQQEISTLLGRVSSTSYLT